MRRRWHPRHWRRRRRAKARRCQGPRLLGLRRRPYGTVPTPVALAPRIFHANLLPSYNLLPSFTGAFTPPTLEPEDEAERSAARSARVVALATMRHCLRLGRPAAMLPHAQV